MLRLLSSACLIGLRLAQAGNAQKPAAPAAPPAPPRPRARSAPRRHPRSQHARLCHGQRAADSAMLGEWRRKLHHCPTHTPAPEMSAQEGVRKERCLSSP